MESSEPSAIVEWWIATRLKSETRAKRLADRLTTSMGVSPIDLSIDWDTNLPPSYTIRFKTLLSHPGDRSPVDETLQTAFKISDEWNIRRPTSPYISGHALQIKQESAIAVAEWTVRWANAGLNESRGPITAPDDQPR